MCTAPERLLHMDRQLKCFTAPYSWRDGLAVTANLCAGEAVNCYIFDLHQCEPLLDVVLLELCQMSFQQFLITPYTVAVCGYKYAISAPVRVAGGTNATWR
jgi:hypothetical protein